VSFEAAMKNLGGDVIYVSASESSVQKGETLEDSVRCLSGVADAIAIRHPSVGAADQATRALARHQSTLIINAGDGTNEHPTQTLIDLYTIRQEIGTLGGICVVFVGDLLNSRTVHSLAKALALRNNVIIHYVSPAELNIPIDIWQAIRALGVEQHTHTRISDDLIAAADVLYMTRLQKERLPEDQRGADFAADYCITPQTLSKAKPTMRILHALPRGPEISIELDTDSRAAYFRQMSNGLHVRMALLSLMLRPQ
jgi:aspartate carbamoyltransferase